MEKHRILIIEDNADTRRFLEAMLSKEFRGHHLPKTE